MAEYTNLLSQFNTIVNLFNNVSESDDDESKRRAKYVPFVFYILCSICAIILAISFFRESKGIGKYLSILMATIFNVPFILFFSIMHLRKSPSVTSSITKM